jgi:hypothetical protein
MLIPTTGSGAPLPLVRVHEYPVVEQSIDSPTHAGFQDRVPGAVTAIRGAWRFPNLEDSISGPNQVLAAFGYRLEINPAPPFSGYALYQGDLEVQRDIAHFWPVSIHDEGGQAGDFLLAFETLTGERLVASSGGISPWPGHEQTEVRTPPVFYQGRIAYAQSVNGGVKVMADGDVLYTGLSDSGAIPHRLVTWAHPSGASHWAVEIAGTVILDGQDFNEIAGYDEVFHWQIINAHPFFFFLDNGLTYLSYAGTVQPFFYDYVIRGGHDEASLFNPGSNDQMVWFYALRDGLWYYVEVQAR